MEKRGGNLGREKGVAEKQPWGGINPLDCDKRFNEREGAGNTYQGVLPGKKEEGIGSHRQKESGL